MHSLLALQQVAAELPVRHYFAGGMYCRELLIPKGVTVIGKIHNTEHLCLITKGKVQIISNEVTIEVEAPYTYVSKIGTQRSMLAVEDTVWTTVHKTDLTSIDEIERTLVRI